MADTRIESPLFISPRPTTSEKEQDFGPSLTKKREIQQQNVSDLFNTPSQKEKSGELFPEIKRTLPLPDQVEEVNFDKPAFAAPRAKKEGKPVLPPPAVNNVKPEPREMNQASSESWIRRWIPWGNKTPDAKIGDHRQTPEQAEASKTTSTEVEPLIGYHGRRSIPVTSKKERDELAHLPNQGGAVLAKLIGMILDYQALDQSNQLDVFSSTSEHLEKVRKKQFDLVLEQIHNRKDLETWSYRREMLEYLGIATGIFGGVTLVGASITTGGASAAPGYQMLAGGAISLTAKLSGKYLKDQTYTPIIGLGGALVSGFGMAKGMAALSSIPKLMATASTATMKLSEGLIGHKSIGVRANQFGINAKNVKFQYQREDNEQTMRKIVGGLKASKESTDLIGATTKALRTEDDIKSRIAFGERA